MFYMQFRYVER